MSIAISQPASAGPTHLDLPYKDDKPVENAYQPFQSALLTGSLTPWLETLQPEGNYFIGADTGIYWRITKAPLEGCKAPDWYYVPNVPRLLDGEFRRSYVMWQEAVAPLIIIEYVSGNGAEERDKTPYVGKFWVYEQAIKAPFYVIWDQRRSRLDVFELIHNRYEKLSANEFGRYRISPLEIELGAWEGEYQGNLGIWLRAWNARGQLLSTPEEAVEQQRQQTDFEMRRAETEKQRAQAETQRAEKLSAKLRELGVDPDHI